MKKAESSKDKSLMLESSLPHINLWLDLEMEIFLQSQKMWFSQDKHWSWVLDTQFDSLEMCLMSCITKARGRQAETNNWRKQKKVQLAFFICNVPLQNPKKNVLTGV